MKKIFYPHNVFAIGALMLFCAAFIIGCGDYYDEGDETAKHRLDKMTAQEKALYTTVQNKWGQRPLKSIREAVSRRETRPSENELPFKDLASVIKTNNTASLKVDTTNTASIQNKYILARWDRVDEDWYRNLMLSMGVDNIVKQELLPEPVEEVIEDKPSDVVEIRNDLKQINDYIDKHPEVVKINIKDIIPESKYDDIFYEIRKCDEAINMYNQLIEERLLTWEDYDLLIRISTKCKAIQIGEKLTEWRK